MSALKKAEDQSSNRERFLRINALKKGKTIEELYPDKAVRLREFKRQQVAEKNPNWRGGKHRNRYPFIFFKLRQGILDRDNHTCQNCEMTELEAISKDRYGRGLTIHHIDYDKENNVLDNLITLCKWCNSSANSRRQEWQMFYQSKLAG
jgi:5-methylcytosine-specific restriction endonuclease McrA